MRMPGFIRAAWRKLAGDPATAAPPDRRNPVLDTLMPDGEFRREMEAARYRTLAPDGRRAFVNMMAVKYEITPDLVWRRINQIFADDRRKRREEKDFDRPGRARDRHDITRRRNPMPDEKTMDAFERLLCEQGDAIDNAVYQMILALLGETEETLPWNMELIGGVADAAEAALKSLGRPICRPFTSSDPEKDDDEEIPCFMTDECSCPSCPMKKTEGQA